MTTAATGMRWRVESWDPSYGASTDGDSTPDARAADQVALDVERPAADWQPVDPGDAAPEWPVVRFVDGVRRVDALAWVTEPDTETASMALCASYAAGVVRCGPDGAHLASAEVRRGLFTTSRHATDARTAAGHYRMVRATPRGEPMADLNAAVQRELTDVEAAVASAAREGVSGGLEDDDLLVVDGPLRGRAHLPRVLGFIKSHNRPYLPAELHRLVGTLRAGQRTPVFGLVTSWQRYTWYLKLPERTGAPWAGVVRVECPIELPPAEAVALADRSAQVLCRYASAEYKDSRAPQNLYPIAGLERELKHRLGEAALLYRAIRSAAQPNER
ncbi:hypothetical protein GCM10023321_43060 [Pseudonocardia eucalypti]|uniref:NurA domain-containing protein n=1 Tax=Pseudonocardia eucalypti TaxID=648755 RepID=A0ABP9QE42_9PSEU|nr:hypothetical protein [Pseudonocardia eucalypti]